MAMSEWGLAGCEEAASGPLCPEIQAGWGPACPPLLCHIPPHSRRGHRGKPGHWLLQRAWREVWSVSAGPRGDLPHLSWLGPRGQESSRPRASCEHSASSQACSRQKEVQGGREGMTPLPTRVGATSVHNCSSPTPVLEHPVPTLMIGDHVPNTCTPGGPFSASSRGCR